MPNYSGGFHYDEKAGFIETASRLRHTVILAVLRRTTFWVLLGFHLLIHFLHKFEIYKQCANKDSEWYIGWHEINLISAMTTFFEVFYTNECWKRYTELYQMSRSMLYSTYDFIMAYRLMMQRVSKNHLRLSCRYLLSAVMLFFYEIDDEVTAGEWAQLLKLGLIKHEEMLALQGLTPQEKTLYLVHWCADVMSIGHAHGVDNFKVPPNLRKDLLDHLTVFRHLQQQVRDTLGLPVPFQYFHLLNWMIVINLLLWGYWMGCAVSPLYTMVYIAASLVFMGMMEVASAFADPFGNDEVDFPVGAWLTEWLCQCVTLLEYESPGEADAWEEFLKREVRLNKDLIHTDIFMDCGFADSPRTESKGSGREGDAVALHQVATRLIYNEDMEGRSSMASDEESVKAPLNQRP